jgi:hypothetical protein
MAFLCRARSFRMRMSELMAGRAPAPTPDGRTQALARLCSQQHARSRRGLRGTLPRARLSNGASGGPAGTGVVPGVAGTGAEHAAAGPFLGVQFPWVGWLLVLREPPRNSLRGPRSRGRMVPGPVPCWSAVPFAVPAALVVPAPSGRGRVPAPVALANHPSGRIRRRSTCRSRKAQTPTAPAVGAHPRTTPTS